MRNFQQSIKHEQGTPSHPSSVIGPDGNLLTIDSLPKPGTRRWVARRKAEVVAAVKGGLITLPEACGRYQLSVGEFKSWQRLFDKHGLLGLRTTQIKKYRND